MHILIRLIVVLGIIPAFSQTTEWLLYKNRILSHQKSIKGWCTPAKATHMMDLIYDVRPDVCVEIGVFGGASIYPTASALKFLNKGQV